MSTHVQNDPTRVHVSVRSADPLESQLDADETVHAGEIATQERQSELTPVDAETREVARRRFDSEHGIALRQNSASQRFESGGERVALKLLDGTQTRPVQLPPPVTNPPPAAQPPPAPRTAPGSSGPPTPPGGAVYPVGPVGAPELNRGQRIAESNVQAIEGFLQSGDGRLVVQPYFGETYYTYFPPGYERLLPEYTEMASAPGSYVMQHPLLERQRTSLENILQRNRNRLGSSVAQEPLSEGLSNAAQGGAEAIIQQAERSGRGTTRRTPPTLQNPGQLDTPTTSSIDFSLKAQEVMPSVTIDGRTYQGRVGLVFDESELGAERAQMTESALESNRRAYDSGYVGDLTVVYDKTFRFGDDVRQRPVEFRGPPDAIVQQVDSGEIPGSALAPVGLSRQGLIDHGTNHRFGDLAEQAGEHAPRITVGDQTYQGDVDTLVSSQRSADERTQRTIRRSLEANQRADAEGRGEYALTYAKDFQLGEHQVRLPVTFEGPPEALTALHQSGEVTEQDLINNGLSSGGLENRHVAQQDWDRFREQHPDAGDDISRILRGEGLEGADADRTAQRILDEAENKGIPPVEAARRWADGRFEIPPPRPPGSDQTATAAGDEPEPERSTSQEAQERIVRPWRNNPPPRGDFPDGPYPFETPQPTTEEIEAFREALEEGRPPPTLSTDGNPSDAFELTFEVDGEQFVFGAAAIEHYEPGPGQRGVRFVNPYTWPIDEQGRPRGIGTDSTEAVRMGSRQVRQTYLQVLEYLRNQGWDQVQFTGLERVPQGARGFEGGSRGNRTYDLTDAP